MIDPAVDGIDYFTDIIVQIVVRIRIGQAYAESIIGSVVSEDRQFVG